VSAALPSGTLTFLFTDIEESTLHLRQLGRKYGSLIIEHASLVRHALAEHGGHEVDTQGDAFFAVFGRARDAVAAAVLLQRTLNSHEWPEAARLRLRIGIHTGEPEIAAGRYFGIDIHRAARICSVARGGQTLVSALSASLAAEQLPAGAKLVEHGRVQLKDFPASDLLYRLVVEGLSEEDREPDTAREPFRGSYDALAIRVGEGLTSGVSEAPEPSLRQLLAVAPSPGALEQLTSFAQLLVTALGADLTLACVTRMNEELPTGSLDMIHRRLRVRGTEAKAITFRTDDPGTAIDKLSDREDVGVVIVGGDGDGPSAFSLSILRTASPETLLHAPGGSEEIEEIFVPFSGSDHDWVALELASHLARTLEAPIILVGSRSASNPVDEDASRLLASASLVVQQLTRIVPEPLLLPPGAGPLLQHLKPSSHLITGVPVDLEERGLGKARTELFRSCAAATFVRSPTDANARRRTATRFSWTLTMPGLDPRKQEVL
jgi:class 3 adenylate cyclase